MSLYADLEIGIRRRDGGRLAIELRCALPDSDADVRLDGSAAGSPMDPGDLLQYQDDPLAYGRWLSERCLFADPAVRAAFVRCVDAAQLRGVPLRVRLLLGADVPELHDVRWETMLDPQSGAPLATTERVLFSRYLSSLDWRPVHLRRKSELTALAVVANPDGLAEYGLPEVDARGELERARRALGSIRTVGLAPGRATLDAIAERLREGCDIFYLVCHGSLRDGEPWLFLEGEDGRVKRVRGEDLVTRVRELGECPRLAVLASCRSGGSGTGPARGYGGALASLGPRLAQAGVPAVLAMQGDIAMETVERLMPAFFTELTDPRHSGEIDRALAVARGTVRERADWWAPALFMRLKSGRIWYVPGFAGARPELDQWQSICGFVRLGQVVPILGPDIAEHIYGSVQDLARWLADENGYPFPEHERTDLAKVTQYIGTKSSMPDARNQVRLALLARLRENAHAMLGTLDEGATPKALQQRVAAKVLGDPLDPLRILAELNARVYVSASANPILETVLAQQGKSPIRLLSHWRDEREERTPFHPDTTPDRPYVHYIFGDLREESTWVLTEDDFFDYLIRTSLYHDLIPPVVGKALTGNSLLFLGFRLDDWRFRILFRMILAKGGSAQLGQYNHVGVQLNPDEHSLADADRAKRYLERYFVAARIDIYWGNAADFLRELARQLATLPTPAAAGPVAADVGEW